MTRASDEPLEEIDPEIERTLSTLRRARAQTQEADMAEPEEIGENVPPRSLKDYATPSIDGTVSSIRRPAITAAHFEIKPATITMIQQMAQFHGLAHEDPSLHLATFLEICDTFKCNGVTEDAIKLRLFPFSLRDKAKSWLISLPAGSITTWDQMAQKFLAKYFPPGKTSKMREEITLFFQADTESLHEAWERYKELLRVCPHHGLPEWLQIQIFYNGLNSNTKNMVDASSGGILMKKSPEEAHELIEEMAANHYQWSTDRNPVRRTVGVQKVDPYTAISAQLEALNRRMDAMHVQNASNCDFCGGHHPNHECQTGSNSSSFSNADQANFVNNFNRQNNPYSNTYNPGWRNHPNFSWNQGNQVRPPPPGFQAQPKALNFEDVVSKYMAANEQRLQNQEAIMKNQEATMKNLEMQLGQLANIISGRAQGSLPSDTEKNPKG